MLSGAGALAAVLALPRPAVAAARDPMTAAALALLEALPEKLANKAVYRFDGPRRRDWHYTPRRRPGVALRDMTDDQRAAVRALLATALSAQGVAKVDGVIQLEAILGELTGRPNYRDPENYALALFGDPAGDAPWGWRFEGHHLSLSFTVVPGLGVAATPAFLGTNPARVPDGHAHAGLRVLKAEHDLAFALLGGLSDAQLARAVIRDRGFGDILTGPGREASLRKVEGLPLGALQPAQRDVAVRLLDAYVGNMRADLAAGALQRVRSAGLEALRFAWAGSTAPDGPHYYRLHGPTALIEYDNSRGGANHVHSVWHDPTDGFGDDLLRRHLERDHG